MLKSGSGAVCESAHSSATLTKCNTGEVATHLPITPKTMKLYNYKGTQVYLKEEQYRNNGSLAVAMYTKDELLKSLLSSLIPS